MKELVHNISLKRQVKRDGESALHDQERGVSFKKLVYLLNLALKLIKPNESLFKITLKTMLLHKTPCCPMGKPLQNC